MTGQLVISLDFELHWGTRDLKPWDASRDEIVAGRAAVSEILKVFRARAIHATWATVGILFASGRDEALQHAPAKRTHYAKGRLDPWAELEAAGPSEAADPFHFAASLVEAIRETPHQEIATHTYSHYYCLEEGQTLDDFRADLQAALSLGQRHGHSLRSIVFPRNQFSSEHLLTAHRAGLACYRGNPDTWFWRPRSRDSESLPQRLVRLADSYLPMSRQTTQRPQRDASGLVNVPATRFLRPCSPNNRPADRLRMSRIRNELAHAARHAGLFHLWWHPNNFAQNTKANIEFLESILDEFTLMQRRYGMRSLTMLEAAGSLLDRV